MKSYSGIFIGLLLSVSVGAESLLEGRVRLDSGEPVADAQVQLFDLTDLRRGAIARAMTDGRGYFALPLAALAGSVLPESFTLGPNYPNPFNPSTIIPYQLAASVAVRLEVFNLLGQRIATLVDGERAAGFHTATWHAVDGAGRAVGAGVYIYRMTVGEERQTGRMVLVDGQAGLAAGGAASVMPGASGGGRSNEEGAQVYGLIVSGSGLVPYVDSSFRVEAGMVPVELVVSSGHSGGKVTDDDCAFCDLFDGLHDEAEGPGPSGKAQATLEAPSPPTNLRFDALTDSSCTVHWDASDGATDYDVNYKPAVGGQWTNEPHRGIRLYNTIYDLEPGTEYRWAVRAENGEGRSAWVFGPNFTTVEEETDETTQDEAADGQAPAAPTNLRFDAPTDSSCTVRWAAAAGATDYDVNYKPAVGGRWTNEPHRGTGLSNTIDDLQSGTEYRWAVRAENGEGRSAWVFGPNFTTVEEEETDSTSSKGGPDLIVQSPSVSALTLTPGQAFTLQATVHNQGDAQAAVTTLHYYRSNNSTITASDTEVGADAIDALDASATSAQSIELTAPTGGGSGVYYGACVASVRGESNTDNNCSSAVRITVSGQETPEEEDDGAEEVTPSEEQASETADHNVMLRVVRVTPAWMPFASTDGWTEAIPLKESEILKYYEVAIWDETSSVHLYELPNDYEPHDEYWDGQSFVQRPEEERIAYREQFLISKYTDMPPAFTDERSAFLKSAFMDIASYLVSRHPNSYHHLAYNGHGGPGGALFELQLKYDHAHEFLNFWSQSLGRSLGVIDMGGPCTKGSFTDIDNFCKSARYYVASDLPNGGYTLDNWTPEKNAATDPDAQYHNLFSANASLEEALKGRIDLMRTRYEASRNYMITNRVAQANYLYSCAEFRKFGPNFKSFLSSVGVDYSIGDDLYQYLIDNNAPPTLIEQFNKVIVHKADNKDFFEWSEVRNGMLMPDPWRAVKVEQAIP